MSRKRPRMVKRCVVCGAKFNPLRSAITCSPECSRERRKQTQFDFNHGPGRESHAKWRQENRDVLRERSEEFRRKNPTYMRNYHRAHKAREARRGPTENLQR